MNKSYISVWNDVSGTWVAAPETAKARGRATASSSTISSDAGAQSRPATSLKAAFMPIAMAIGAMGMSMTPGMAAAQAVTGNGGLELCPGQLGSDAMGSSWGPVSSAVQSMRCNNNSGMSFSLNNGATDNGANGYTDGAITARVAGYADGHLELAALSGIYMLNTVNMRGNKITQLGAGDVSLGSSDAVNGGQLYQYTRYFQANSPSTETASSARATGSSSVASGPYSLAAGANSSAYGANAVALASNSVALGAGSVASRSDAVSVGYLSSDGKSQYTRQITNVTAGAAGTDAVNVNQLNAAIASVNGGGGGGTTQNAVTYDSSLSNLITLKGTSGTKITNLIAGDATSKWSTDAVNGGQLFQTNQDVANVANNVANVAGNLANVTNVVNNFVNNGIAGNPLIVTYDSSARDIVTLGGTAHTAAVKLTNVAAGDISSANSTDAVNGGQLFQTNQTINSLGNNLSGAIINIYNHGVKYFHTNSTLGDGSADGTDSVAVGALAIASANNSVALGSNSVADRVNAVSVGSTTAQRQIINVAAGTQSNDAVNLGQMNAAIAAVAGGGSPDAVIYDSSAHNKLTLGGAQATSTVGLTNVAAGQVTSASKDAVNGAQLYGTASTVANALGGGSSVTATGAVTNPTYTVQGSTYNDVGSALSQVDTAISGLNNEVANSSKYIKVVSAASSAIATGSEAVSIGGAAYASGTSAVAIGSGARSQFANSVALGANSRVTVANTVSVGDVGAERRIMNVANGVSGTDAVTYSQLSAVQTALSQQISQSTGLKSMLLGGTTLGATPVTSYIAVSSNVTAGTTTSTDNSLDAMAIGPTATALGQGSLAVGAGAGTALAGSTAVGSGAAALALDTTVIGAGATTSNAATNAVAIGYNAAAQGANALSLGSTSMANASNALAMGGNAVVTTTGLNAMAFGANATANQANAVALGYSATAGASNAVALGSGSLADRANTVSVGSASAQRQVVNVAAGTLGNDAVNINQLTGVTGMIGGGAGVNADGTVKKPSFIIGGQTYSDVGSAITAATASGSANAVQYDSSARNKVTLGGLVGTPAPVTLTNVANGVAASDAVNVAQLQAMGGTFNSSGVATNAFVAYDDTTKSKITLGGAGTTKAVTLTNVANGISTNDAVNVAQLQAMGGTFNSSGVVTNAFVAYDDTTKSKITLGGAGATRAVTLGNVANGIATNDAVNVAQLQAMGGTFNSSGVVTNAFVAYDDTTKNTVTLKGASGSTKITGLKAGTLSGTSLDAVNGSQLYSTASSVANALGGGSTVSSTGALSAPSYQLSGATYSDVGSALSGLDSQVGAINNNIADTTKYIKVVSASSAALATGGEAVAIGGGAYSSGTNAVAIGSGARSQFADSVALGSNSRVSTANSISVGDIGSERRIMNVANGVANTDAVTLAQLNALKASLTPVQSTGLKSMLLGAAVPVTNYIAVSTTVTPGLPATSTDNTENAMAIGPGAMAQGAGSVIVGAGSGSFRSGSTVVGSYASAAALNATVIGDGATTDNKSDNSVAIGYMAAAQGVNSLALGSNSVTNATNSVTLGNTATVATGATNSMALGAGSTATATNAVAIGYNSVADRANAVSVGSSSQRSQIINVAAGTQNTDAVNLGQMNAAIAAVAGGGAPNAVVYDTSAHTSVTLGAAGTPVKVANVADGVANNDAVNVAQLKAMGATIGSSGNVTNAFVAYDDTSKSKVTFGGAGATAPVILTNVGAGQVTSSSTQAINGSQLYGAMASTAAALGGGASVNSDGTISKPTYKLNGGTYSDVGAALVAAASSGGGGSTNAVLYDTSAHTSVTLNSAGAPVKLSNVADGVANNDAVNVEQLKAMGASIGSSGNVTNAFVAYDDTTKTKVTFGGLGSTTPVILSNVGSGQVASSSTQAINGSQLYGAMSSTAAALGGSSSVTANGTVSKPAYVINGSTYSGVGAAISALDAQSRGGSPDAVIYDTSAHDKLTLGGAGSTTPVTIANVADATSDNEAVNLKQLKAAGLNVDPSGNVTNAFVAYDNLSKGTVTFNSGGTPTQLKNVAAGTDATDAVNVDQMKTYVAQHGGDGTANGVAYDDSSKTQVTLGGAGSTTPVTLTNVADGKNATDAVNYGQFSALENTVKNFADGGGSTYITVNNPGTGGTAAVASGTDAIAIGNGAVASGSESIAIGKDTKTTGDKSVAMGSGASAPNANSVALGANSTTDRDNTVSVGSAGAERQITNVAAGTQATDAVNLGQLNNAMGSMSNSINNVDRNAAKGIAAASALNIVTPYLPGRTTINAGVANYRGYQAVGLGVSRWNEKGTINYNLGVSSSGGNSTIVRAGIGIVLGN